MIPCSRESQISVFKPICLGGHAPNHWSEASAHDENSKVEICNFWATLRKIRWHGSFVKPLAKWTASNIDWWQRFQWIHLQLECLSIFEFHLRSKPVWNLSLPAWKRRTRRSTAAPGSKMTSPRYLWTAQSCGLFVLLSYLPARRSCPQFGLVSMNRASKFHTRSLKTTFCISASISLSLTARNFGKSLIYQS